MPSLLTALDDPYVSAAACWITVVDILSTLPKVNPSRGTPFFQDADKIMVAVQLKYLNGEYADAKAALDDAANQIAGATSMTMDSSRTEKNGSPGARSSSAPGTSTMRLRTRTLRLPDAIPARLPGVLDMADH